MNAVLIIPLVGPMQSWGTRSRFQERDTEREPSKSGVIGLLCAALGRDRSKPVDDLAALRMGVRVDREGLMQKDFQTAKDIVTAEGKISKDAQISSRYFLSDAVFLVGLEGDEDLLRRLHAALANPKRPLFLGRKSYVPSLPLFIPEGVREKKSLREVLLDCQLLCRIEKGRDRIRMVLESSTSTHESRMDTPVSFALGQREFRERFIVTQLVPIDNFKRKEDTGDVPDANLT